MFFCPATVGEDSILPRGVTRFDPKRWANPYRVSCDTIQRNMRKNVMWREDDILPYSSGEVF